MAFDPSNDFSGLENTLKAAQFGQNNPALTMSRGRTARGLALQDALHALGAGDIALQGQEDKLSNDMRMNKLRSQESGPMDILSNILSAGGALKGGIDRLDTKGQNQRYNDLFQNGMTF
jgi:hypothetical protein